MDDTTTMETSLGGLTTQEHSAYSAEQHDTWSILYRRRMSDLAATGSRVFLEGAKAIGLSELQIPELDDINRRLAPTTGWRSVAVSGYIPAPQFFAMLARREFPTTVSVRPRAQLDYLPEPDIFHDVFGHVPMQSDPVFADFLERFGAVAAEARTHEETERMARLFWFTVEFGLVRENGEIKAFGSGLISSHGDCANALSPACEKRPFSLEAVMDQPFEIDHLQNVLFVIDSWSQLFDAVARAEGRGSC